MDNSHITIGMLAHVDAGKTTLSESLLFLTGRIRQMGRVDHQDAFLDSFELERRRGITIFSKQAEIQIQGRPVTLLDTPGHVDFSAEMERTMQVLDMAVLLVSAPDGVTGQVRILWKLLEHYGVPVFVFVNKMDQPGMQTASVMTSIRRELGGNFVIFRDTSLPLDQKTGDPGEENSVSRLDLRGEALEELVVADDTLLSRYLEGILPSDDEIRQLIAGRSVFPVFFGSALKMDGIDALLEGLDRFAPRPVWPSEFGARVFKISSDDQGKRLSWLKITGGTLHVRDSFQTGENKEGEKVSRIRILEGNGARDVQEAAAGSVCAVEGLSGVRAGDGLGADPGSRPSMLQPFSSSRIFLDDETDLTEALKNLRILDAEEPMLHIGYDRDSGEITAQVMGQVQMEVLRELLRNRFGMHVHFGPGRIIYRETIAEPVEGVGHYEPLRHYAEVHLLMEPAERGSGLTFDTNCSTDVLKLNWQRLILTHLQEKEFRGVLTGSGITDMRITVIGGRAHEKHTEGGDFREATYRAVRQGLMMANNVLLEPYLSLTAEIPPENAGRVLNDVQRMGGTAEITETGERTVIEGTVPAAAADGYPEMFLAATHGTGRLELALKEYAPCRNAEQVILESGYDPDSDTDQPSWSVFCSHGAGCAIPWDRVREYMHVDTGWKPSASDSPVSDEIQPRVSSVKKDDGKNWKEQQQRFGAEEAELEQIFERTYGTSFRRRTEKTASNAWEEWDKAARTSGGSQTQLPRKKKAEKKPACLLADGYNIIYADEELKELAQRNLDAAREQLLDMLADYHGMHEGELIAVFDAYRVPGGTERSFLFRNLHVVFTKEAETADAYIEKTVHRLAGSMDVTVATSDGLEQMIILGAGARRMSARELLSQMRESRAAVRQEYLSSAGTVRSGMLDGISEKTAAQMEDLPES